MEELDFQEVLFKFASQCDEELEMAMEPEEGDITNYEETDDRRSTEDSSLDEKVHQKLDCTKGELLTLVLSFYLRHGLSKSALQDLLSLLNILVPGCIPETLYFIKKFLFNSPVMDVTVHYYCRICEGYMGTNEEKNVCLTCNITEPTKDSIKGGRYFLVKPIQSQLKTMLSSTNLWGLLKKNDPYKLRDYIGEVFTGSIYQRKCIKNFMRNPDNFTMFFSTDGINPTSDSNITIWPLFVGFNELRTCHKSEFLFMQALWVGCKKPRMSTLFTPFIAETEKLTKEGFKWSDGNGNPHHSRVKFILFVADAPARAALCDCTQYNGECGCMHCEHPGKQVEKLKGMRPIQTVDPVNEEPPRKKAKKSEVRVFPFMLFQKDRTHADVLDYAEKAVENGRPFKGVKGFSRLLFIPDFDMPNMTIPESLHCFWEGIGNQFLKLWSSDTGAPYYVVNFFIKLDESILNIHPPDEIKRAPRSFNSDFSLLKASELRSFCLFYSCVVLQGILPSKYYNHWLLVVNVFRILYQQPIPKSDLLPARLLADKFIIEMETLYGEDKISYNVHLLTHVVDAAERLGAPWSNSAFIIESACGEVARLFKGPTHIGKQIFERFLTRERTRVLARNCIPISKSERIIKLYDKLDPQRLSFSSVLGIRPLGAGKLLQFTVTQMESIALRTGVPILCSNCKQFQRISIEGKKYSTDVYCRPFKRNNSIVQLKSPMIVCKINCIVEFNSECACRDTGSACKSFERGAAKEYALIGDELFVSASPPIKDHHSGINLTKFIGKVRSSCDVPRRVAFLPSDIECKCIIIPHKEEQFCLKYDLMIELD